MGYYLQDHPPASPQFRVPRREAESGIVFVHTAESVMDDVGPDTGAENVAGFISRRKDPGSYHEIADSDSDVQMMPDNCEAFQVAANGHNRHGWGICGACAATDWNPDSPWTKATITRMGQRIRAYWERKGIDPKQAARWISKDDAEARRGPGLICHGDVQPRDRTDAWVRHPRRAELNRMLIAAIGGATPTRKKQDMISLTKPTGLRELLNTNDNGIVVVSWESSRDKFSSWHPIGPDNSQPAPATSLAGSVLSDGRLQALITVGPYGVLWAAESQTGGGWSGWYQVTT